MLSEQGKPAEAEAEYRKALAIWQKLADDNPAVTEFRHGWRTATAGSPTCCRRRASRRRRRPSTARRWRSGRSWPTTTPPSPTSATTWRSHRARRPAVEDGQAGGGGGRVPQGAGDPAEAGRRQPRRHRLPQRPGGQPLQPRHPAVERTGKPAEAEAEFRKALAIRQKLVDDNPSDIDFRGGLSYDYLRVAALQAWFGQDKELSSTCEKLLSLAKDTEDPALADKAAKCCSLRQADPKRCEAALVLARRAVEHGKGSQWLVYFEMALGMAEYRSGHFAEADAALTAAMNDPGKNNAVSSTSAFYRAMGLFRQGKTDLARKLATEAAAKMKPLPVDEQKPLLGGADHDDLIMWLAYKEAKAMIQFDATPAAPAQPHTK